MNISSLKYHLSVICSTLCKFHKGRKGLWPMGSNADHFEMYLYHLNGWNQRGGISFGGHFGISWDVFQGLEPQTGYRISLFSVLNRVLFGPEACEV